MAISKRDFSMLSEMNELVIQTKADEVFYQRMGFDGMLACTRKCSKTMINGKAPCKCFRMASQKYLR